MVLQGASCLAWADHGECSSNPDYMAASCAASCNHCQVLWTDRPLATLQLRSGHDIPTIGYGTATLKERTKQAVLDALAAGYRLLDSAQVRECCSASYDCVVDTSLLASFTLQLCVLGRASPNAIK